MKFISSKDNQLIKKIRSLSVKKYREQFSLYLIEGEKVVLEAIKIGDLIDTILILDGEEEKYSTYISTLEDKVLVLSQEVYNSLSSTKSPQKIMAVVKKKEYRPINSKENLLVLDHLQDPGNLGTIIRSCVAFGIENIVLIDSVDPFNDKTIRSASGTIFYPNFYEFKEDEFINFAKEKDLNIVIAEANKTSIFDNNFKAPSPFALVIGNEGNGVSNGLKAIKKVSVSIPMARCVESLNAGVSASILMLLLNK